jgi:hypothetical protein
MIRPFFPVNKICSCFHDFSIINKKQRCYSEIVFIIHGFTNGFDDDWLHEMKDAIISKKPEATVFIVDWEEGAKMLALPLSYITAAKNSKIAGFKVGEFILDSDIDPKSVHCIGHSLGEIAKPEQRALTQ